MADKPMTREEFLRRAAEIHDEWAQTARYTVDEKYSNNPSQYTEGIQDVSPFPEDDRAYMSQVDALIDEFDRSNGRPTRDERREAFRAGSGKEGRSPRIKVKPKAGDVDAGPVV